LSAVEIDDRGQIVKPALKPEVGEILGPDVMRVQCDEALFLQQINWSWLVALVSLGIALPPYGRWYAASLHDPADAILTDAELHSYAAMSIVFVLGAYGPNLVGQLLVLDGAAAALVPVAAVQAEEGVELGAEADIRLTHQGYFFERDASAVSLPSKP
jgi:hypothetical protein